MPSKTTVYKVKTKLRPDDAAQTVTCSSCPVSQFAIYGPTVIDNPERFEVERMSVRTYGPNQTILAEGRPSPLVGTIRAGWALMFKSVSPGKRYAQAVFVPGDFLAVDLLYTGDLPAAFGIKAITDVTVCWFEADTIRRLLGDGDGQRRWTHYWTYYYFAYLHARAATVAEQDARGRLAQFLIEIADRLNHRQIGKDPWFKYAADKVVVSTNVDQQLKLRASYQVSAFDFPLTQAQISQCLGLTNVYVNRVLGQFAEERLLEIREKKLHIYDMEALTRIAAEER